MRELERRGGAVLVRVVWILVVLLVLAWCWTKWPIIYYGVTESAYSETLASSMFFVALGLSAALWCRFRTGSIDPRRIRVLITASRVCALAAMALVAASAWTHAYNDHSSDGKYGSMSPLLFVREHPAFIVVALLSLLVLWWSRSPSRAE